MRALVITTLVAATMLSAVPTQAAMIHVPRSSLAAAFGADRGEAAEDMALRPINSLSRTLADLIDHSPIQLVASGLHALIGVARSGGAEPPLVSKTASI